MNFLKSIGAYVSSNAIGGLPYVITTSEVEKGNKLNGSTFIEDPFDLPEYILHTGHSKSDIHQQVSIFKSKVPGNTLTQNAFKRLKTLRHPNILAYLDGIEIPNNGPIILVTESVIPLQTYLETLRKKNTISSEEYQLSIAWGLRNILMALQFIIKDCKLIHGRITPSSIFVTKGGDWKLSGFELTTECTSYGPSGHFTANENIINSLFKSPECMRREWNIVNGANDIYAFACIIYYAFNEIYHDINEIQSATNIPHAIRTHYRRAIDTIPTKRPTAEKILSSNYFESSFIKRMEFLEHLAVKSSDEKTAYYKDLCANLSTLPTCFGVYKVLPALKAEVDFGAATSTGSMIKLDPSASHMLPAMVKIGASLEPEEFKQQVLPIIVKLFSCPDRAVRVQLLQMMEKFAVHFDSKLVNSPVVFDNLCSGFSDASPILRELTIKSMLHIAEKLTDSNLNTRVMKYFTKLQSDVEPAIRTNTIICLGRLANHLNEANRPKTLFPAFSRALKDPFPHARLAGLRSFIACAEYFTPEMVANNVLPVLSPLLLDVSSSVRVEANDVMAKFLDIVKVEVQNMTEREAAEEAERQRRRENGEDIINSNTDQAQTSSGYASSITSWATSAVASNVGRIVGGNTSPSSVPTTSSSSANIPTGDMSRRSSGNSAALKLTSNSTAFGNTLGTDDLFAPPAENDAWGLDNDDLDLDSPKTKTNITSGSTSNQAIKLNVKPIQGSNGQSSDDKPWEDDGWGTTETTQKPVNLTKPNTTSGRKTIAQRKAEAQEQNKSKSSGAMKLNSAAIKKKNDEWDDWNF